jgi:thiosulfate dehydrogenase [quinone] large subunit
VKVPTIRYYEIDRIDHRKASAVSATAATPAAATPALPASTDLAGTKKAGWGYTLLGLTRLMVGFTFLWAFLDKTFGFGFATPAESAWLRGGSPTTGFLGGSIEGGNPFAGVWSFFLSINPLTDVLFMLGLLGVGLALMLGIGTRVAAVSAAAMYTLMYLAAFPMSTNPLYDTHLLLAVAVLAMAGLAAGDHVGLGKWWNRLVKGNRFLI